MTGDTCSPYIKFTWNQTLTFWRRHMPRRICASDQKYCGSDSWAGLPYIDNLSYKIWGWCISMILTQTGWLTREAIRVACWERLVIFCANLLSGYRAEEGSISYRWSLVWLLCWRSLSSVLEKLLLGFACWEKFIFVSQKILPRYLAEKSGILDRKLLTYHAEKTWGSLHHKFLLMMCGRRPSFLHLNLHTNI